MWEDFYKIKKIYEDYNTTMQGNYPNINNTSARGSYDQPMANGPGHGPVNPQGGPPSTGDLMHFGNKKSPHKILNQIEEMVKEAIEEADSKGMDYAASVLKKIYSVIVDKQINQ